MAIIGEDDVQQKWKYRCKSIQFIINAPGKYQIIDIPGERMTSFNMLCDYKKNMYPITNFGAVMDDTTYYNVLKYRQYVTVKIRMSKFYNNIGNDEDSSMERIFLDNTYKLILDDNDVDMFKSARDSSAVTTEEESDDFNNLHKVDNNMDFYIYQVNNLNTFSQSINGIMSDTNMMEATAHVLNDTDAGNILWKQFDNTERYDTTLLPPYKTSKLLKYMDTMYGFYDTGSMIFADYDRTYIMPYNGNCEVYEEGEIKKTVFVVPDKGKELMTEVCSVNKGSDSNSYYVVSDPSNISIRQENVSNNIVTKNNAKFVNDYQGSINQSNINNSNAVVMPLDNKSTVTTLNKKLSDTYASQSGSKRMLIETVLGDYDISSLKPNKQFNFSFTNTQYTQKTEGNYILTYANHNFTKSGNDFLLTTSVTFCRDDETNAKATASIAGSDD